MPVSTRDSRRESQANALGGLRQIPIDPFLIFDCVAPQVNKHLRLGAGKGSLVIEGPKASNLVRARPHLHVVSRFNAEPATELLPFKASPRRSVGDREAVCAMSHCDNVERSCSLATARDAYWTPREFVGVLFCDFVIAGPFFLPGTCDDEP